MVGLDDLEGLFQFWRFYDSVILWFPVVWWDRSCCQAPSRCGGELLLFFAPHRAASPHFAMTFPLLDLNLLLTLSKVNAYTILMLSPWNFPLKIPCLVPLLLLYLSVMHPPNYAIPSKRQFHFQNKVKYLALKFKC